ncbi:MAG: glycosyltransferase family 2 protein [Clostridia bacterium]
MKTLIIIPAYNESENIERVVNNLILNYPQYDYAIVNDGSRDNTVKICKDNGYNLIDLPVNLGLSGAFQTGMMYAFEHNYDYAIQFDGDGQHRAEFLEELINEAEINNIDIVIGSRFVTEKKQKSLRMMGNNLISAIIKMTTGKKINDPTSGMRLYDKTVIKEFAQNINYGPEPDTIAFLMKNGLLCKEIQVKMDERIAGESYLNLKASIAYMMKMCISILLVQWVRKRGK